MINYHYKYLTEWEREREKMEWEKILLILCAKYHILSKSFTKRKWKVLKLWTFFKNLRLLKHLPNWTNNASCSACKWVVCVCVCANIKTLFYYRKTIFRYSCSLPVSLFSPFVRLSSSISMHFMFRLGLKNQSNEHHLNSHQFKSFKLIKCLTQKQNLPNPPGLNTDRQMKWYFFPFKTIPEWKKRSEIMIAHWHCKWYPIHRKKETI